MAENLRPFSISQRRRNDGPHPRRACPRPAPPRLHRDRARRKGRAMTAGAPVGIADAAAFERWVARALPGELAVYHVGRLAEDREGRPEIDRLARIALVAGRQRFVTL